MDVAQLAGGTFAALNFDFAFGDRAQSSGVKFAFGDLNAGVQGVWGVVVENGHDGLGDDGAAVDALIDEMDGAAGDFNAVIKGLSPGLEAGKRREERGMDVDDPVRERA